MSITFYQVSITEFTTTSMWPLDMGQVNKYFTTIVYIAFPYIELLVKRSMTGFSKLNREFNEIHV
jgi:hypothetical protein